MTKITLIAEIGINHNGEIELAKKLIDQAVEEKWDIVKFQKRDVDVVVPKEFWNNKLIYKNGNLIDYIDYKRRIEFGEKEYDIIDKYCREKNIDWFASAWDSNSLKFLRKYDLKYNKVASALLTNKRFLEDVAREGKITFISTGMSTLKDIDNAIDIFNTYGCKYIVMHCTSIYPCPPDKLNLSLIKFYKDRYKSEVGYSSHFPGILDAPLSVVFGARYIEKHITLDRAMWGSDQSASLERLGMKYIRRDVDLVEEMIGKAEKVFYNEEKEKAKRLRYW